MRSASKRYGAFLKESPDLLAGEQGPVPLVVDLAKAFEKEQFVVGQWAIYFGFAQTVLKSPLGNICAMRKAEIGKMARQSAYRV